jgi:hypothetical protein
MLKTRAILYNNQEDLENLLTNYKILDDFNYNAYEDYTSEKVIKIFENVFLK